MAWNNQGGPWGGGGGDGPWGNGGNGGNSGGRGPGAPGTPPDLDDMLRKSQEKIRDLFPGGKGGSSGRGVALLVLGLAVVWGLTGFYRVNPNEQGVELLFGKYVKTTNPGLNYWFPAPIGEVQTPSVTQTRQLTIGYRGTEGAGNGQDQLSESMMLTGDQNIIDVNFVVQWRINDAGKYLFNIANVEETLKMAAESAMRETIGQVPLEYAMTDGRSQVAERTQRLLQQVLDGYGAGVSIMDVKLQKADPPREVIDAFNDVQRARQDKERLQNEATAYRNDILPRAKGEAERLIQEATAYREQVVRDAQGEAARFVSVYDSYRGAKDVTAQRLYLETLQGVLAKSDKVLIDNSGKGSGVIPYLPLPEITKSAKSGGKQE